MATESAKLQDLREAIAALEAQGIQPTAMAVEEWLAQQRQAEDLPVSPQETRADEAAQTELETTSNELPPLRGRRPIDPPYYVQLAGLVANGTPLRQALWRLGVQLTERQLQNIYRHKKFRQYLDEARIARWQAQCRSRRF